MRLRNKKTGEIKEWQRVGAINYGEMNEVYDAAEYNSLAEFNEEWEDVRGPLIKDEKVRKAVRAWADANNVKRVYIVGLGELRDERKGIGIEFNSEPFFGWVSALKTITELCGEEKEPEDDDDEEDLRAEEY